VTQGHPTTSPIHLIPSEPYGHCSGDRLVTTDVADGHFDMEQLRNWLYYCNSFHSGHCHDMDPSNFFQFPRELILIDLTSNKLSLCNRKERYSALSYVWGQSSETFATLRSNFNDLSKDKGLLKYWEKLPATLKDAMFLSKALGIPYLWVDRLCILQDDEDSKQHNISWMASIYANSYLAIVAAEGSDANHGIRGIGSASGPREGNVSYQFADVKCTRRTEVERRNVWHTRGWTFQERTLARRSLVFHGTTVHWECERARMDENVSTPRLPFKYSKHFEYLFELKTWPDFEQYATLCHQFSHRKLSFERDVTDAFSSTTNALTRNFPGGFLYAMPELLFSLSLLWFHRGPATRRPWLPSWSWIGWDGVPEMSIAANCDPEVWDISRDQRLRERYCCPMARWRKRDSRTQQLVSVDDRYHIWQEFERDRNKEPPAGWTYIEEDVDYMRYFVHKDVATEGLLTRFLHPVPVAKPGPILPDLEVWDTLIYGTVHLVSLRFDGPQAGIAVNRGAVNRGLHTASGQYAGELWIHQAVAESLVAEDECLAIAMIHTVRIIPNENGVALKQNGTLEDHLYSPEIGHSVHILWVEWEDGVAYRRGTGRIRLDIWKTLDAREIEIVLG
jgi:hypothetical protein